MRASTLRGMYAQTELCGNALDQIPTIEFGVMLPGRQHKGHDLVVQLMGPAWAGLGGHQTGQTAFLQRLLGFVERRA